ncbi:hypothetical protein LINPERPRIM_LOCUS10997 [Linum perenne]
MGKRKLRSPSPSTADHHSNEKDHSPPQSKSAPIKAGPSNSRPPWSRENELALLNGIITFKQNKDSFDMASFTSYMQQSNSITVWGSEIATEILNMEKGKASLPIKEPPAKRQKRGEVNKEALEQTSSGKEKQKHKEALKQTRSGNEKQKHKEKESALVVEKEMQKHNGKGKRKGKEATVVIEENEKENQNEINVVMEEEDICVKYPYLLSSMEYAGVKNVLGLKDLYKQEIKKLDEEMLKAWEIRWKKLMKMEVEASVERENLLKAPWKKILDMLQSK